MNKAIVITTISPPSIATQMYLGYTDWTVIVVGDTKTPHDEYRKLEESNKNFVYLAPADQDRLYPELSAVLGWKNIERRNVGYVYAYNEGAQVIASVDDDNIPYPNWGRNAINSAAIVNLYDCETPIFDPLSATNHNYLWHRGFPLSLARKKNNLTYMGKTKVIVGVQADLWDGDPDIDAFQRITIGPCVKFDTKEPYMGTCTTVFDSQNTFFARECFPAYSMIPFIGSRMSDIFGSYYMQVMRPDLHVIFGPPSVYQQRNPHDLRVDMRKEYLGYEFALDFVEKLKFSRRLEDTVGIIPKEVVEFYRIYQDSFKI